MPKVTVIMNCYNSAEHLREAMDSVFRQSWPDWEIVFWDNCSTDDSAAIAQSYGQKVRYFLAEKTVPLGPRATLPLPRLKVLCWRFWTVMTNGFPPSWKSR